MDSMIGATAIQPELERENVMSDRDAFVASLDDLAACFAAEAKRGNLSEGVGR
jgi:hypothetical protein